MTLADTSIWIDHFRFGDDRLAIELQRGAIFMHPFVSGELSLGSLPDRAKLLRDLNSLPCVVVANVEEVRLLIEQRALFSRGIGYIDAHLLASVALTPHTRLWTRDKRLRAVAESLGLHVEFN